MSRTCRGYAGLTPCGKCPGGLNNVVLGRFVLRIPFIRSRLLTATAVVAIGAGLASAPVASLTTSAAAPPVSSPVNAKVFTLPLNRVGEINLSEVAKAEHRTKVATHPQGAPVTRSAIARSRFHAVDNALISRRPKGRPTGLRRVTTT